MNAKSATMNDCHVPAAGDNREKQFYGVQSILGDSERLRGWDLMTHGGFLTYPHHDAGGLCTYVTVRSGSKIWAYIGNRKSSPSTRQALFKEWDSMFSTFETSFGKYQLGAVVLECGDTL